MSSLSHAFHTVRKGDHVLRSLQNRGKAEEMQKGIVAAPHQLTGILWEPCDGCGVILSVGPFWGTSVGGFAVPASLQFGDQRCLEGNLSFSLFLQGGTPS